ncbi:helix-turn-helix transcriptional regulator [Streptomyces antibioticus]
MKLEEAIGKKLAWLRNDREMSQAQLGEALGRYLEKPWSRQAVNAAEQGKRAFTARDMVALALALETSVPSLLLNFELPPEGVELQGGQSVRREEYRKLVFHPADIVGKTSTDLVEGVARMRTYYDQIRDWNDALTREIALGETLLGLAEQGAVYQKREDERENTAPAVEDRDDG